MRRTIVAGNWKMHGSFVFVDELLPALLDGLPGTGSTEVVVMPPFPYLALAAARLANSRVAWGAQNVSQYQQGAYTGEVAASMLSDLGCRYVLVGHSERRQLFAETSATVAEKFAAAVGTGLVPIVCVGETLDERDADTTFAVVDAQLQPVLDAVRQHGTETWVIAYEPVWAIGTGRTASPEQAQAVHAHIRARLVSELGETQANAVPLLYGGSVKPENAQALFAERDIDGGLIGGASLNAEQFLAICRAAGNE